jgi:hypothetical protein
MAITGTDIWNDIEEQSGVDTSELPRGVFFVWFPAGFNDKGQPNAPTKFEVGKPVPSKPVLTVFALFQDDQSVRVYALANANQQSDPPPPHRYTLSKISPTIFTEVMGLTVFKEEIAVELIRLAGQDGDDPEEPDVAGAVGADVGIEEPVVLDGKPEEGDTAT